jgi:NAD(P)-dependent dehydrogenase (short-subunit alcohol dehydrogenase family)
MNRQGEDLMLLENSTVLITGVGTGLGRECALAARREGADVVIAARSTDTLDTIADEVDPTGDTVLAHPTDIGDPDACATLVAAAIERFGRVDALVQVAAYDNAWGGVFDMHDDQWRRAFDTNVLGSLNIVRALAPSMRDAGGGSIVLIGSQSMFLPHLPQAGYAASKAALLSTTYHLADELGPDNIRVNMVVPSWMMGPPVQLLIDYRSKTEGKSPEQVVDDIAGDFPLGRMTGDDEVADVVTFFCSSLAKAVTGQHLLVNAGELKH